MTARRVAFVELWRLGDAVIATAGLRALRLACPDAEIALVADPRRADPLIRSGDYDIFIPFAPFWTRTNYGWRKYLPWAIDYAHLWRVWRQLRAFHADTFLLFRGDPREQIFCASIGGGEVVDARYAQRVFPGTRLLPRIRGVPRYQEYVHHIRQWSGTNVSATPHIAHVAAPAEAGYVVVHPGASWQFKQWAPDRTAIVVDALLDAGSVVYLVGGPGDRQIIDRVRGATRGRPEVRYPTLEEFYTIVRGARAIVCQNSSALHIAEALGTPCIALTGPSDVVTWGVFRPTSVNVCKSVGLPCYPCEERRCVRPTNPCIDEIAVSDVLQALGTAGVTTRTPVLVETAS